MRKSYRQALGWAAVLAFSLLAASCAQQPQSQPVSAANAAAAAGADRQGHFDRTSSDMAACVVVRAHERNPDLHFDVYASQPNTVSAKKYQSDETAIWVAEFHDAGTAATDVMLRNASATASDLDALWRIVEACAAS